MLIQGSRDQCSFDSFPGLIAVFHALHRLLAPRHPPHALNSLAALIPSSIRAAHAPRNRNANQLLAQAVLRPGLVTILFLLRAHAETRKKLQREVALPSRSCDLQLLPLPNCQRTFIEPLLPAEAAFGLDPDTKVSESAKNLETVAEQEQRQPQALHLLAPSNVEMTGFEPVTSWLQTTRSPN